MKCVRCECEKDEGEFYKSDKTCKECRKRLVRDNRRKNLEYYREYEAKRYRDDPRKKEALSKYASSEKGRAAARSARSRWLNKNQVKRAAHIILGNAISGGKITKPCRCEECGVDNVRIHGHHDDYSEPLSVRWLCSKCHNAWHAENGSVDA